MKTSAPVELPPARTEPLAGAALARSPLSRGQRATMRRLLGGDDVFLVLRSATRVDVGGWLGGGRLCLAATADALLLFAAPRRRWGRLAAPGRDRGRSAEQAAPLAERIPLVELFGSTYNHVTGELLLTRGVGGRAHRLKLPALDAYQLLAQIHHRHGSDGEPRHA